MGKVLRSALIVVIVILIAYHLAGGTQAGVSEGLGSFLPH